MNMREVSYIFLFLVMLFLFGNFGNSSSQASSCKHPLTVSGEALDPSCDPCVANVCSKDSYCCDVQWDNICVGEVGQYCGSVSGSSNGNCGYSNNGISFLKWNGEEWKDDSKCNITTNFVEYKCYFKKYGCVSNSLSCELSSFKNNDNGVYGGYYITNDGSLTIYTFPYTIDAKGCKELSYDFLSFLSYIKPSDKCARVKLFRDVEGTYGKYMWKVYIPEPEQKAKFSVGMFLYHDDKHELDFECGYGFSNYIYCYTTSQGNPYYTNYNIQPYVIETGVHTFEINLSPGADGHYTVSWIIDGNKVKSLNLYYGPEIKFKLFISAENLDFMGEKIPKKINYAKFYYAKYIKEYNSSSQASSCKHPLTVSGEALDPSCDPCVANVCSKDSYCCDVQWDNICVGEVGQYCGSVSGSSNGNSSSQASSCKHPLTVSGEALDPSCDPCVANVCSKDSYCCDVQWDNICVGEVGQYCGSE